MLTGRIQKLDVRPQNDHRKSFPQFQAQAFKNNLELVKEVQKLDEEKGCKTAQFALSWTKSHSGKPGMTFILPVFGVRSKDS